MTATLHSGKTVSAEEQSDEQAFEPPKAQRRCPECEGRIVTEDDETYCGDCGLVVHEEELIQDPTLSRHGPDENPGEKTWTISQTSGLRLAKGLGSQFNPDTDGYGRQITGEQFEKYKRLQRRDKRYQVPGNRSRSKRLGDSYKEIKLLGSELGLGIIVQEDAARLMRGAKEARLPGAWTSWEGLAAGAVMLAAQQAGTPRDIEEVTTYAKVSKERVCAAARMLRVDLNLDVAPIREDAVGDVIDALSVDAVEGVDTDRIGQVARGLLAFADEHQIRGSTSRLTMAGAAVYAADRLTDGKAFLQDQVVAAVTSLIDSSKWRIGSYSREVYNAYTDTHGADPGPALERANADPA